MPPIVVDRHELMVQESIDIEMNSFSMFITPPMPPLFYLTELHSINFMSVLERLSRRDLTMLMTPPLSFASF
jgi:hypothetical protein